MRFLKPLDTKLLHRVFKEYQTIITLEDGCLKGGFGSSILEFASDSNYKNDIIRFGAPDNFIEHGSPEEQRKDCGYDKDSLFKKIKSLL